MVADNVLAIGESVATLCLSMKLNVPPIARSSLFNDVFKHAMQLGP